MTEAISKAASRLEKLNIRYETGSPLAARTSFRIGGPADLAVFPSDTAGFAAAEEVVRDCGIPSMTVGRGTNLLFSDKGVRGAVLFTTEMDACTVERNILTAAAGCRLASLASKAAAASLSGLEFAHGIPGSVGGGVVMNAGAYGGQLSDRIRSATVYDAESRTVFSMSAPELGLSYRHSVLQDRPGLTVLEAVFEAVPGDAGEIAALMKDLAARRRDKQPLEYPSAGSVFKRPGPEIYVGKMIQDAGLKGFRVGGAEVSEKHAGFIVNRGGATCADVLGLIETIQKRLGELYGIVPEVEIRIVPEIIS